MPTFNFPLRQGLALLAALCLGLPAAQAQTAASNAPEASVNPSGPVRLRPALPASPAPATNNASNNAPSQAPGFYAPGYVPLQPVMPTAAPEAPPGEFERYVQKLLDPTSGTSRATRGDAETPETSRVPRIRRFGADFMNRVDDATAAEDNPLVPPDYLIKPGDEVVVTLWGSVDADVRAVVDRSGRISIPRVGPIFVSGVRYADLPETISKRVAQVFRNFELSASLGRLRGLRVFVTGYVARPGAYSVSSLSTLTAALTQTGGPTAAGSFRNIMLRREGKVLAVFDLYDFLLKGDRSADRVLQPDDVIQVGPVGPQVALIGSINQPSIFEIKAGETVKDVVAMAGGFSALADRSRLTLERLGDRSDVRIREIALPAAETTTLTHGDVMRAFSAVDASLPIQRQNKRVRVDGEVQRPGEYVLPPNSSTADALRAAGGLTPAAFLFGAEFSRESVRVTQQENYERALRDLETEFTRAATTQRTSNADEAAAATARGSASARLIERLRAIKPTGRVVLQMQPGQPELPDLALEDGDRIYIPPRATTIGVFGSVFNGGSYLFNEGRMVEDYLRLAGGPTRGADTESAFVIRANGSVISGLQSSSFWRSGELKGIPAMPGDTIFVPEEINKTTFVQSAKDWTQIIYQLGIGLAAVATFRN
jgi:protein involved in polysaccharide export with SLBB domain